MDLGPGGVSTAKYSRPSVGRLFRRERLLRDLDGSRGAACSWVEGLPGSGKTSLLACFVAERSSKWLWYQVDPDDGDPLTFLGGLTAAIQAAGDFDGKLPRPTPDLAIGALGFARHYFRALFAQAPDLLLVLDDYHQVGTASALHDVLRIAIEQVPPAAHIAVASRSHPPGQLARCVANGAIVSMTWRELALSVDEVVGIAGIHGAFLDEPAARRLHDRCGGWAAGLRLLLLPGAPSATRIADLDSPALVFDYLYHEVFRDLAGAVQSHLLRLAFLPRIPADLVDALVGSDTAERALAALADENMFVAVSGDRPASFRLHPLFRDFLVQRARAVFTTGEILVGLEHATKALEASGLIDDAAQMLIEAKAWDQLGELALRHAPYLMSQGRFMTLERWLSELPSELVNADAWLSLWLGSSQSFHDPLAGRRNCELAFELFELSRDRAGLLLAWSGVVDCIFRIYANLTQLDPWIERLENLLAADPGFPAPEIEAKVTFSMFVALSFRQPQHAEHSMWRQRLDAVASASPDPMFRMFSRHHLTVDRIWLGDLHAADVELRRLQFEVARLPMSPVAEMLGVFAEATYTLYTGEVAGCFRAIDRALGAAESSGMRVWDKVLLGQGAALALSHGDLDRGRAFIQRRTLIAGAADDEEESQHHAIEAWSNWLGGMPVVALANARQCIAAAERMGLPYFKAVGGLAASIVSFECGDQEGALSQVETCRALGRLIGNPMVGWMADMMQAYMQIRRGQEAVRLVESSMTTGAEHGYRHFFFWPREAIAVVCFEALRLGIQVTYVCWLIEAGRLAAPSNALGSDLWPWPVKVSTLGNFSVVVRGTPISFTGKTQRAPLRLLKAVIAFGGYKVAEAKLVDALWPDSDGAAGEQALATTLFRLRKLVGAGVVQRHDGFISLNASECWVDCRAFERMLAATSDDSDSLVHRVKRFYVGPFLQDEEDAPWALQLRERLHVALMKKLSAAATGALARDRVDQARCILDAGLEIDDLVEEFHRGQMKCHILAGQPSEAVNAYRHCQRILSARLGVEPSAATTRLYLSAVRERE